jgi:hypothetical protein
MTAFRVLVADKVKAQLYELLSRRSSLKALPSARSGCMPAGFTKLCSAFRELRRLGSS